MVHHGLCREGNTLRDTTEKRTSITDNDKVITDGSALSFHPPSEYRHSTLSPAGNNGL